MATTAGSAATIGKRYIDGRRPSAKKGTAVAGKPHADA